MPRNIDLWCAPGLNTDIQPGFYCAHCAYELDQEYADKFEHPCAACGRIVIRAKAGAALLCPECKPTYAPLVRRYYALAQRGANGVRDLPFSFAEFLAWLADQPQKCHWCGVPVDDGYHFDHVMPVSRGGKSALDNLVISCPTCNSRKSAQLPSEWQRSGAA